MSVTLPIDSKGSEANQSRPILVVDDSRAQRHLLVKTLTRWGYSTIEADSGEAAVEICQGLDISFVISDWMMPGMSGVEFCREFRKIKGDRPAYFILLTAQTDRQTLAEGLDNGADDFLSKPFHVVELKARIRAGERVLTAQGDLIEKNELVTKTLDELQEVYAAVDRDLREARKFQQALVPEHYQDLGNADLSFLYHPSGHVGGDLVGLFRVSEQRYGVFSVDVAGHGVASALMTARIAGHLNASSPERNVALMIDDMGLYSMHPPDEVCRRLNTLLLNELETDDYFTMVLADVDLGSGRITMSQAGHPSPAIQRKSGEVEFVSSFGMPIGLVPDAEFSSFEVKLEPGDRLFLYSDGVTECPLPNDEMVEEAGFEEMLKAHKNVGGLDLMACVMRELEARSGLSEFPDDLSGVLLELK